MKTPVIMEREIMGVTVRQNHKTKMFNANDLHKLASHHRKAEGLPARQIGQYFDLDSTQELMREVCLTEVIKLEDVKKSARGKNGGTWIHPIIFIDMAMWYSPKLKVRIINWVLDGLMELRDESGESFKRMNSTLSRTYPKEFDSPLAFIKVSKAIAEACNVGSGDDKWQRATKEQLELRTSIQENIELIADLCPNSGECLNKAISKAKQKLPRAKQ